MLPVPVVGLSYTRRKIDMRPPAQCCQLRSIEQLPGRSVGLCRVEDKPAFVADYRSYRLREFEDCHLRTGTDVYGLLLRPRPHQEHERLSKVVDVEKLAARRTGSPDRNCRIAGTGRAINFR